MATYDYPLSLKPESMEWVSIKRAIQSRSPISSTAESVELPGEKWACTLNLPPRMDYEGGAAEAFFSRVVGGLERVRLYNFQRPQPLGTMRGSPTVNASAVRGDLVLSIATTGTLKAGDFFKVGSQLFQALFDCAPVAGVLTVPLVQRVRSSIAAGAAVAWDRPTALFVLPVTENRSSYGGGIMDRITHEFFEVYA